MSEIEITHWKGEDKGAFLQLWNKSVADGELPTPIDEAFFGRAVGDVNFDFEGFFVARVEGRPIGFGLGAVWRREVSGLEVSSFPGFMPFLLVKPDYRRRGAGSRLLERVEGFLRGKGKEETQVGHVYCPVAFGVDLYMGSYPVFFFLNRGYKILSQCLFMRRELSDFRLSQKVQDYLARNHEEGITYSLCFSQAEKLLSFVGDILGSPGWRESLAASPNPALVGRSGSKVIAFMGPLGASEDGRGQFTGIGVHPDFRRKHIGSVIYSLGCEEMKKKGATFNELTTNINNPAQEIYFAAGHRVKAVLADKMVKKLKG